MLRPLKPTRQTRRLTRKKLFFSSFVLVCLLTYVIFALTRPIDGLQPSLSDNKLHITTSAANLPWPAYGQSAFGLSDGTVIADHGEQTSIPIASAAKIITALCVLQKYPLTATSNGPVITLNANDEALYNSYIAVHGSVVPVRAGLQITERQAMEALLLPSANNIADTLAVWAFGSVDAYRTYANAYLQSHGVSDTRVGSDASGFAPDSTSTARDLVKLGSLAIQNDAVATIVAQKTATFPGVGTIRNVDTLLGSNGIVGIKTGNSDQDGGVFIGAAKFAYSGTTLTVISAIAGGSSLNQVLQDSANVLAVGRTTISEVNVIHKGDVLATFKQADGSYLQAIATADLNLLMVRGDSVNGSIALKPVGYQTKAGDTVGSVNFPKTQLSKAMSVPLTLKQTPHKPSLQYRLLHP